jgi:acyl-[acyl-carrier-protein]-phospholipid O-acyltransferase/long-chain-fatty-acid--[acyl-carrier-protein] ligase
MYGTNATYGAAHMSHRSYTSHWSHLPIEGLDTAYSFIDFLKLVLRSIGYPMPTQPSTRTKPETLSRGFLVALALALFGFLLVAFVQKWTASQSQSPRYISIIGMGESVAWLLFVSLLIMPSQFGQRFRERIFRLFGGIFARSFYRIKTYGLENLPKGGFLLLPNHMTYVDAVVLQLACPRPIRFVVHESIYQVPWLNPVFRLIQAIPISNVRAKEAVREAAARIKKGEIVCIYPEGELSRTGVLIKLRKGFELIARLAECEAVPVWLDGLWGSIFSFEGGRYFFKLPRQIPQLATIAFGKPIAADRLNIGIARERLLELGEFCFQKRPELNTHLGRATVKGLKRYQFDEAVIDGMDGRVLKRGDVLAASIALSRWIKQHCPGDRVAVVLPPGVGAIIANVAITLANKIPVNLNFTSGRAALQSAINRGQILHAISAKAVMKRLEDFPWPRDVFRLEELIPELKPKVVGWRIVSLLTPHWLLSTILGLPLKGDGKEAALLFTSGTSGEPKGVALTHRNIIGNVAQFSSLISLSREDSVMASLPFFHCFGCTVTLWYPIVEGVRTVTYPTPVDVVKNAELIERHRVSLLVTTPTFLRGYLKRAQPEQFRSIKLLITGAEKLPQDLREIFQQRFGKEVLEGYGLTETSPVVSTNLPDPSPSRPDDTIQPSNRVGSVGKLLPGQAAQIRHPETGEALSPHELGMLWLKGPNIFGGYLNQPERTADILRDGWFKTGDLARFDEDGFLYIEGRESRFSKIAGEMVPHETIETIITELFGYKMEDERIVAIVGVPDEAKGEALVMLTARDMTVLEVREKLLAAGIPSLWIPKTIKRVEKIPILGSGKLDLGKCKDVALAQ